MALVDVTQNLTDPDFMDPVVIIHRKPTVNDLGENILSETRVRTIGSVQPASGKTLSRIPEAFRVANVSSFWVRGEIVSDGTCAYPDLIEFRGQRYQVQTIADYTNWASPGYCEGSCVRERAAL